MSKSIKQEACQLFIEQEIEEAVKQDDINVSAKAREIAVWLGKLFEVEISQEAIRRKIQRAREGVHCAHPNITVENNSESEDIQVGWGGKRENAGRPIKLSDTVSAEFKQALVKEFQEEKKEQRELKQEEQASHRAEIVSNRSVLSVEEYNKLLPELILADPPWKYDFSETDSRKIENQYPTATVEEMKAHLPETAPNCVLLLWATAPKLLEAIELLHLWGFEYKTNAIWDKVKIGMGYWFRGQHELLLVGVKGKVSPPAEEFRVGSIFTEAREGHSIKPECVYDWIDRSFPHLVKLEMYARKARPGWSAWGNEI